MIRSFMIAAIPLLLLLSSCGTTKRDPFATIAPSREYEWPAPPEQTRVRYVTSIFKHKDLFVEGGIGSALARIFGGEIDSRLVRPYAIAVYPKGGLLVTDPGAACVHFFDWPHRKYRTLGSDIEGGLPSPVGVAVANDGTILVSDSRRAAIERFASTGKHLGAFGDTALQRPAGIAVDPATGDVYVADVLAHAVVVFSPTGQKLRTIGSNGSEPGQFNYPTHIAISPDRQLLVADSMNFRIQRLGLDGSPLSVYGRAGDSRGDFARPKGIAAPQPNVLVAVEGLFDSLVFFDADGNLLLTLGGAGSGPGQFWLPAGLAVDPARHLLFVADSYNSRVQVFQLLDSANGNGAVSGSGVIPP